VLVVTLIGLHLGAVYLGATILGHIKPHLRRLLLTIVIIVRIRVPALAAVF
jgi:hypothetical protein